MLITAERVGMPVYLFLVERQWLTLEAVEVVEIVLEMLVLVAVLGLLVEL
jgi:hypothetical protein